jgi:hypothetical protein
VNDLITEPAALPRRFLPASPLDFTRYAKNLAWLLDIKLHQAREALAFIYGYENLHELDQALKDPNAKPGPFWDEEVWRYPEKTPVDGFNPWPGSPEFWALVPRSRSAYHQRRLDEWWAKSGLERRGTVFGSDVEHDKYRLITDLGLTDSPASHRDCHRRLKKYLDGEPTIDSFGFPTGFWSNTLSFLPKDEKHVDEIKQLATAAGYAGAWGSVDTVQLLSALRSADLFVLLAGDECERAVAYDRPDADEAAFTFSMWDVVFDQLFHNDYFCKLLIEKIPEACQREAFDVRDEEGWGVCEDFLITPNERTLSLSELAKMVPDPINTARKLKYDFFRGAAESCQRSELQGLMLLEATEDRQYADDQGNWVRMDSPLDLGLVMRRMPWYGHAELWNFSGTVSLSRAGSESEAVVGMAGSYFVPVKESTYSELIAEDIEDNGSECLDAVWSAFTRSYLPRRGISGLKGWLDIQKDRIAIGVVELLPRPQFNREEWLTRSLNLLSDSWSADEYMSLSSSDNYWEFIPGHEYDEDPFERDEFVCPAGLIVIIAPGIDEMVMSIHDSEEDKPRVYSLRDDGTSKPPARRAPRPPGFRQMERQPKPRSAARSLLEAVADWAPDMLIFDPVRYLKALGSGLEDTDE